MLAYKDTTRVNAVNSADEVPLFSLDLDRLSQLNGGLPLGENQVVRITSFGEFQQSTMLTPNAYFRFRFGPLETDQIVYLSISQSWRASFELVLGQGNSLVYCASYMVGDNGAEESDNRVGVVSGATSFDVSAPLVASLSVELSDADEALRCSLLGYIVEVL